MGYNTALDLAGSSAIKREQALLVHLQSNHYPPVHSDFVKTANEAIDLALQNMWEEKLELPNGRILDVYDIVEGLHLHAFIEVDVLEGKGYEL